MRDPDRIDPSFRAGRASARKRRRARLGRKFAALCCGVSVLAGLAVWWFGDRPEPPAAIPQTSDLTAAEPLAQTPEPETARPDPFLALVNLPRDPLVLRLPRPESQTQESLTANDRLRALAASRIGAGGKVALTRAELAADSDRIRLDPPSTPEDFALYQARRNRALSRRLARPFQSGPDRMAVIARAPAQRGMLYQDRILIAREDRPLVAMLRQSGLDQAQSEAADAELQSLTQSPPEAARQTILALRFAPEGYDSSQPRLRQISLYGPERYIGSLAQIGPSRWLRAANPWDGSELQSRAKQAMRAENAPPPLLDALYTTALQSGLDQDLAGNLVAMIAQRFDLDRRARPDDTITLLTAEGGVDDGLGRVLYVGLPDERGSTARQCYVVAQGDGWACAGGTSPATAPANTLTHDDDDAISTLIARIIHVESGGRANARNPRSSALGPGQFIISTWLRMISQYHPELMRSLSRDEVLALRTDPVLSVEMVYALTRENRAYLAANNIQITAGRLYLAHFLGPQGAVDALRAQPDALVASVMGQAVVSANPFLTGRTIADLQVWAERKVGGAEAAPLPTLSDSPETRAYRSAIDALLAQAG